MRREEAPEFRAGLESILRSHGVPVDMARSIEDRLLPVSFQKGAVIFTRGSSADLVFWLLKGFAKLYLPHHDGDRTLVDLRRSGDLLSFATDGDSEGRRHVFEAHALTKCSVGLLSVDQLLQIMGGLDQQTAVGLLVNLNAAWSITLERYVTLLGSSFRKRLEIVICNLASRFGINEKRGMLLVPELSHEDLANMIGSSRPMVSKLIADMLDEGVLMRGEMRHFIVRMPMPKTPLSSSNQVGLATNARASVNFRRSPSPSTLSPMVTQELAKNGLSIAR